VLVGDQNVGKSSIIVRYIKNDFDKTNNVTNRSYSQQLVLTLPLRTYQ
jgi:GTPase SAR1 family protein